MSKDNQKYVKTLAKVCRKKKYVTALKSMSTTSKSMSQHTEYVKSSPIFLMISGDSTAPSHCWFFHPTPIRLHGIAQVGGSSRTLLPLSSLRRVRAGSISVSTEPCKKWQRVWPRHRRLVELEAQRGWVVTGMMVTGMIPNQRMLGTRWVLGRHPWRPSHNAKA